MSDSEAEVLSNSQSIEIVGGEERDREFFNSLRVPSITKETIINLSSDRLQGIRSQVSQLESVVTDLRSTITDLRSAVTELRQSLGRATRATDESSETIDQLQKQLQLSNELIEHLKTELAVERNKVVSSDPQSVNMTTNSQINNNSTSSPVIHNHQPTATLNVEKSNIKATQPEPFSGEKTRLVNDWLAAVKRYLMLSGAEETKWVAYAVTMFTSTALNWWNSVEFSNPEKSILDYSWGEFVDLVRERFVPVDSETVAMSKMSQWKQTGSVATYISQFQNFDQLIPKERLDEEMRVQMFIQGLKPECKSIINMWEPKTLQQVYKMAQKFDNGQRQSHPKFSQHNSTRNSRTRNTDQQEGTRNNPITFNNTEMQTETQQKPSEEGQGEDDLNLMNSQNGQRGVCHYCKSPDHYMNVCPKLKKKRQFESESHSTSMKVHQSSPYSKN
jgi:hypothetical protein